MLPRIKAAVFPWMCCRKSLWAALRGADGHAAVWLRVSMETVLPVSQCWNGYVLWWLKKYDTSCRHKHHGEVETLSIAVTVCSDQLCAFVMLTAHHFSTGAHGAAGLQGAANACKDMRLAQVCLSVWIQKGELCVCSVLSQCKPIMYCRGRALLSAVESGIGRESSGLWHRFQ